MGVQIINTILGLWILISPFLLHFDNSQIADYNYITGPVIVSFSVIAYWEATRSVGKWNILVVIFLIIMSLILGNSVSITSNLISSLIILPLSLIKGKITQKFGGGWASLFQKNPEHLKSVNK